MNTTVRLVAAATLLALSGPATIALAVQNPPNVPPLLSPQPISGATSVPISPNIMFVLDDSLSMSWTFLPDWAGGSNNSDQTQWFAPTLWQSHNSGFNGIYYNPAITYAPPVYYTSSGALDTTTYRSQTAANTANWTAVADNPYLNASTDNLIGNAYFYTTVAGEYCTNNGKRVCNTQSSPDTGASATYTVAAPLRWCNTIANANAATPAAAACQATEINNQGTTNFYAFPRMPFPLSSTVTLPAGGTVSSIQFGGQQILSASTGLQSSATALATALQNGINACTFGLSGSCSMVGYMATANGAALTIYAPGATVASPSVTASLTGGYTFPSFSFGASTSNLAGTPINNAPGSIVLTVITSTTTSYPEAATRTDCVTNANSCTYAEEMTNYANWWAYYRTRMQTMKTAASRAFAPISSSYRVGFISIDNNNATSTMGSSFLNIDTFGTDSQGNNHKKAWYDKLFAATPTSDTPLRLVLSQVGQIYAGKLNGQSLPQAFNGTTVNDPVQFSCQQNVTILSTDGYWNGADSFADSQGHVAGSAGYNAADQTGEGYQVDGMTLVGDQDGPEITNPTPVIRAQLDGGGPTYAQTTLQNVQTTTPTVATQPQSKIINIQSTESQLQTSTVTQVQQSTNPLQIQQSNLQQQTFPLQSQSAQLLSSTSQLQQSSWGYWVDSGTTQYLQETEQIKSSYAQYSKQTETLQIQTSALLKQTSTLQSSTSTLQAQTSTLQSRSYSLQQQLTQVQQSTSSNGGATWSAWSNVATCVPVSGQVQCQLLATSAWTNVSTCNVVTASANPAVVNPGQDSQHLLYTTTSSCQYAAPTAWANAGSCTTVSKSAGPTSYTVGTAVDCQYTAWSAASNVSSCTSVAQSSASPYTVGSATLCTYSAWSTYANVTSGSCTPVAQSTASPYTVATATQCQYSGWSTASSVSSCTAAARSTAAPYSQLTATTCTYGSYSSWANTGSTCTASAQSSGAGTWTGPATNCQYSGWGTASTVTSCTAVAPSSASPYTVTTATQCTALGTWSTPTNTASCTASATVQCTTPVTSPWTPVASCTPGTSGSGVITLCQQVSSTFNTTCPNGQTCTAGWGPWTNVTSCANNGTQGTGGSRCQYLAYTTPANAGGSCTVKTQSSGTGTWSGPAVNCSYAAWGTASTVASCSPSAETTATANNTVYNASPVQCSYGTGSAWSNTASCTTVAKSTSPYVNNATSCRYLDGAWTTATSACTPVAKSTASPYTVALSTQCQYPGWGTYSNVASCTPQAVSPSAPYTVLSGVQCSYTWSSWTNAASCTPAANSIQCQTVSIGNVNTPGGCTVTTTPNASGTTTTACPTPTTVQDWTNVASCSAGPSGNNEVLCQTVLGPTVSTPVAACTPLTDDGSAAHNAVTCSQVTTGPTLNAGCTASAASSSNNYTATSCAVTSNGPTPNTLADVAQYYYMTPLRDASLNNCSNNSTGDTSLCTHNVPTSGDSTANWQHMVTYTLGLGASGWMQYDPAYKTATSGDYYSVKQGTPADPGNAVCSWQSIAGSTCNWPTPLTNTQTNIDDLWHAAVNGRGTYYSASNPTSLASGLANALAAINVTLGSSAAATVSTPNITSSNNFIFKSAFAAGDWSGDLMAWTIDISTGNLSTSPIWTAQAPLDNMAYTARTIYTLDTSSNPLALKTFSWANLSSAEQAYFTLPNIQGLTQFCSLASNCLSTAQQSAAAGANLVNFVRGDRSNENTNSNNNNLYRQRAHVLGDIADSQAVYVGPSQFSYGDYGYAAFVTANANRQPMVYAGGNDGMLHAFYVTSNASSNPPAVAGNEAWAYIPHLVMPQLYKLADTSYKTKHQFYVDGTPVVGDICTSNCDQATANGAPTWITILVGGLNNGGRGYYALDITNPATPKALWEYSDNNLGYTYGNPRIAKLTNGNWVVMFGSGYNNVSPGDGQGRLYVLNAVDGTLVRTIDTGVGSTSLASGLSRVSAWTNYPAYDATALRVYGGDLLGNLWRFDINNLYGGQTPGYNAQLLAILEDPNNTLQPITTKPELGSVGSKALVLVGTGMMLGTADLNSTQQQSFYGILDPLTSTATPGTPIYNNPRSLSTFVQQTLGQGTCPDADVTANFCTSGEIVTTSTNHAVDYATNSGWYVDFLVSAERSNTDAQLALGTLAFVTNAPEFSACVPAGTSYLYFLDYATGGSLSTTGGLAGRALGDQLSMGAVLFGNNGNTSGAINQDNSGKSKTTGIPVVPPANAARRVSWRVLPSDN